MRKKIITSLSYAAFFLFFVERCAYNDTNMPVDCTQSDLAVVVESTRNATSCKAIDGEIAVSATGGLPPYNFKINDNEYQTGPTFIDLGSGTYSVRVKDLNNCWRSMDVTIGADGSDLTASASTTDDNQCTTNNGTIAVTAAGGLAPYVYQLDAQGFGAESSFANISDGIHVVLVKDANDCQTNLSVQVGRGTTGISYANSVQPIFTASCTSDAGCHGPGTGTRDWTKFENVKSHATNIKMRTSNKSMPPNDILTQTQIDQIACWVDDGAPNN